jgi:hypothetical protein
MCVSDFIRCPESGSAWFVERKQGRGPVDALVVREEHVARRANVLRGESTGGVRGRVEGEEAVDVARERINHLRRLGLVKARYARMMQHEQWLKGRVFQRPHMALMRILCPPSAYYAVDPPVCFFYPIREFINVGFAKCDIYMIPQSAALFGKRVEHVRLIGRRVPGVRVGPARGCVDAFPLFILHQLSTKYDDNGESCTLASKSSGIRGWK